MTKSRPRSKTPLYLATALGLTFSGPLLPLSDAVAAGRQEHHAFTKEIRKTVSLNYLLYLPPGYGKEKGKNWPLILFLHGSGERGDDLDRVKTNGPPRLVSEGRDLPFIIVSPQAPRQNNWDPDALNALLDEVEAQYPVDHDRVYLTGLSMGGSGTWRMAAAHPERFAAIAPICGSGDPATARTLAHMPVWAFHGAKDELVPVEESREMVAALKEVGNPAKLTVYPDLGHDSWTATYNDPALFEWFLSHKRGETQTSKAG
jgi:predicted peptidase